MDIPHRKESASVSTILILATNTAAATASPASLTLLSALANFGAFAAGIAAVYALYQTNKQSKATMRPILAPYFEFEESTGNMFLKIENMGNGPALLESVELSDNAKKIIIEDSYMPFEFISETSLLPKRSIRAQFNNDLLFEVLLLHADNHSNPFMITVTTRYKSAAGDSYNEKTKINLTFEYASLTMDPEFLPTIQ